MDRVREKAPSPVPRDHPGDRAFDCRPDRTGGRLSGTPDPGHPSADRCPATVAYRSPGNGRTTESDVEQPSAGDGSGVEYARPDGGIKGSIQNGPPQKGRRSGKNDRNGDGALPADHRRHPDGVFPSRHRKDLRSRGNSEQVLRPLRSGTTPDQDAPPVGIRYPEAGGVSVARGQDRLAAS